MAGFNIHQQLIYVVVEILFCPVMFVEARFVFCCTCGCDTSLVLQSQIHSQEEVVEFLCSFALHLKKFLLLSKFL